MIKIFQRIRQKLLEHSKMRSYFMYAIGEIVLVVIGILIALQINNWNENRKDLAKEKAILKAIHNEFIQNRTQLDSALYYHKKSLKYTNKLVSMFPINVKKVNLDSVSKYAFSTLSQFTYNPSQGSIKAIISTSTFDLIQNDSLRTLLISWPDLVSDFTEDELKASKTIDEIIDPFLSKHFDFEGNFKDKRNHLNVLESLEFEYIYKLRKSDLIRILGELSELKKLTNSLNNIIKLSKVD